jgi:hypothetical protein
MALPLATVLSAAPGLISAAADMLNLVRKYRQQSEQTPDIDVEHRIKELNTLIEQQALVIEELAKNNQQLTLAVRNNRRLAAVALGVGAVALLLALLA